jgi:hypothetical protein
MCNKCILSGDGRDLHVACKEYYKEHLSVGALQWAVFKSLSIESLANLLSELSKEEMQELFTFLKAKGIV